MLTAILVVATLPLTIPLAALSFATILFLSIHISLEILKIFFEYL